MTATPSTRDTDMLVHDERRKRQILFASCAALMAVIASVTGLNVAQQELALDFGASQSTVLWIINAYTLALAAMLMPVGAIGDRWGRKPVLLAGLAMFVLATVAAALAPSSTFMIIVRVVAGVSAAMIMPVTLSVITSTFPEEERAQAIGVWAGVAGGGGLIGMFVAALMVDLVDWRWLFVLPIALAVVAAVATVRAVPNSREQTDQQFDLQGSLLSMVAVSGLVFAIHEGPVHGWSEPVTLLALFGGLLATLGFVVTERRSPAPLLDVRVFGDRRLATGSVALIVLFGVLGGVFIVLFPYFQGVLGWSALRSTAALLPMGLLMMASSALAPKLVTAVGNRTTSLAGIGIAGAGLATMAMLVSVDGGYLSVLPGMLVIGAGMGLTMTPSTEAITASLPADRQGVASALNDTTRELGSALGVALLGAVLSAGYRDAIGPRLVGFPDDLAAVAGEGLGAAHGAAAQAGARAALLLDSAELAFVEAWSRSMWAGVIAMAALFAYVFLAAPGKDTAEAAVAPPEVPRPTR